MSPTGRIFDIARGSFADGPGLRTVVFLKGCPLGCAWCHNPEGRSTAFEMALDEEACIGCGACERACERSWATSWRDGCTACGRCADVCPGRARRRIGRDVTTADLVEEVCRDLAFMSGTGGGVTFSGGEPLCQPALVIEAATLLSARGVHVAVQTAGIFSPRWRQAVVDVFDLVLFDLKHVDAGRWRAHVHALPDLALDNLRALVGRVAIEIRITLVPGFNDSPADVEVIAGWLSTHAPGVPVWLQPFHRLAASKQARLGRPYAYASQSPLPAGRLQAAAQILRAHGIVVDCASAPPTPVTR